MHQRLTFTVGTGFTGGGRALDEVTVERRARIVRQALAQGFGGFTETRAQGGWINDAGALVMEPSRVWTVVTDRAELAEQTAAWLADVFEQTAVMLQRETLAEPVAFIGAAGASLEAAQAG
jgi:hypothetical protein